MGPPPSTCFTFKNVFKIRENEVGRKFSINSSLQSPNPVVYTCSVLFLEMSVQCTAPQLQAMAAGEESGVKAGY